MSGQAVGQASVSNDNNPATNSKPSTANQSNAVNGIPASSPTGGTTVTTGSNNPNDTLVAGAAKKAKSYATPVTNDFNTFNKEDYSLRSNRLNTNNNRQKVALVGRVGQGARTIDNIGSNNLQNFKDNLSIVVFEATPEMQESSQNVLIDIGDIRAAASIVIYMGSPSRMFSLTAKFISRTPEEADENMNYINTLKAWREPAIKGGTGSSIGVAEPETLRLFAYGDVLKGIPVLINNLSIDYPSDVDYILSSKGNVWVPIIQNVTIGLKEARSFEDLNTFDYDKFKSGTLEGW